MFIKMKCFIILTLFLSFDLITTKKSTTNTNKKLRACSELMRARITQDSKSFEKIIQHLSPKMEENDDSKLLMMVLLAECYSKIKNGFADDLIMFAQYSQVDSMKRENKNLISLPKWSNLFMNPNRTNLDKEIEKYKDSILELNKELSSYSGVKDEI